MLPVQPTGRSRGSSTNQLRTWTRTHRRGIGLHRWPSMSKSFNIEIFLTGVLTGSNATRQRHVRQAKLIHEAISKRWHLDNPWNWKRKHLLWFIEHHKKNKAEVTRYRYKLTINLIAERLGKNWCFLTELSPPTVNAELHIRNIQHVNR